MCGDGKAATAVRTGAASVLNTDGIALTQREFGPFRAGAFFAVHDDGTVAALQWSEIAGAPAIRADCTTEG